MSDANQVTTVDVPLTEAPKSAEQVLVVPTGDTKDGTPIYRVTGRLSHLTTWLSEHFDHETAVVAKFLENARRATLGHAFKVGFHAGSSITVHDADTDTDTDTDN